MAVALVFFVMRMQLNYRSDKLFENIIIPGHAFHVLLEDADIFATFSMLKQQMKPDGFAVLESRNPVNNGNEQWDYDMTIQFFVYHKPVRQAVEEILVLQF